jgi:hypothetical protein
MFLKKIIAIGLVSLIFIMIFCLNNENPTNTSDTTTNSGALSYGTFLIKFIPENLDSQDPAYTSITGTICDGPSPPNIIFKEVMSSGSCKLLKAVTPNCSQNCQLGYTCVSEDSCMPEPKVLDVGTVTVNGLKNSSGLTTITMEPPKSLYYQMVGVSLVYPPCSEGDTITLSATGKDSVAPFTIKARGITPLVVLNGDILVEDGKDINLQWVPPAISGVSTINVRINISYHGGTKGEIQCDCEDNGSLTIPGAMLDKLKSYGIAGYPLVEITRKSVGTNADAKASVIVQCSVTKLLTIPGVTSCNQDGDCPGKTCVDRKCQ